MFEAPKVEKKGRNAYRQDTVSFTITLPYKSYAYLVGWAHKRKVTISRAVHDILMDELHLERGDYKPYGT